MAKKQEQAALAVAPRDESSALAEALDFDFDVSGLEEVDAEDLRFAVKVWNMRSKKPNSEDFFRVDEFFDTLTEETTRKLRCVFVTLHKTNDYSYFDEAKQETVRVCTSYDRETGTLRMDHPHLPQLKEGTERQCEGCPDAQWAKNEKGKNVRNCSSVYGVIGVEFDANGNLASPFMIRFKKTGLNPFKTHMQKHHIKRRKDPKTGKMVDVPLFAYAVEVTLKADPKGQFAVPEITRGELLPREIIMQLAEQAKSFREMAVDVTKAAERKEAATGSDNVVETTGSELKPNDFAD